MGRRVEITGTSGTGDVQAYSLDGRDSSVHGPVVSQISRKSVVRSYPEHTVNEQQIRSSAYAGLGRHTDKCVATTTRFESYESETEFDAALLPGSVLCRAWQDEESSNLM